MRNEEVYNILKNVITFSNENNNYSFQLNKMKDFYKLDITYMFLIKTISFVLELWHLFRLSDFL